MKSIYRMLILIGILSFTSFSCIEDIEQGSDCGCDSETIESYQNVEGTISRVDTIYYIKLNLPENRIGVKPCTGLNDEYKFEGLKVKLSGKLNKICPADNPTKRVFATHPFVLQNLKMAR
jgi:hypothetical protein